MCADDLGLVAFYVTRRNDRFERTDWTYFIGVDEDDVRSYLGRYDLMTETPLAWVMREGRPEDGRWVRSGHHVYTKAALARLGLDS